MFGYSIIHTKQEVTEVLSGWLASVFFNLHRNMQTIKLGDPQPKDCPKCKEKHGYKLLDSVKGIL